MTIRALLFPDDAKTCIISAAALAAVWFLSKFAAQHLASVAAEEAIPGGGMTMTFAERISVGAVSLPEVLALVCALGGAAGVAAHVWRQQSHGASRAFGAGVAALCVGVVSSFAGLLLWKLPAGQLGVRAIGAADVTAASTMAETIEPAELLVRSTAGCFVLGGMHPFVRAFVAFSSQLTREGSFLCDCGDLVHRGQNANKTSGLFSGHGERLDGVGGRDCCSVSRKVTRVKGCRLLTILQWLITPPETNTNFGHTSHAFKYVLDF